jgi:hypothetical protein
MTRALVRAVIAIACTCTPNVLSAQQPVKDGAYFCTVEFSGGLAYNQTTKRWQSTTFRPDRKFVVRLKFIGTKQEELVPGVNVKVTVSSYDITITPAGMPNAMPCLSEDGGDAQMLDGPHVECLTGAMEYRFNFQNNRFLQAYMVGYVEGKDEGEDTPSMSGGTCTRIE